MAAGYTDDANLLMDFNGKRISPTRFTFPTNCKYLPFFKVIRVINSEHISGTREPASNTFFIDYAFSDSTGQDTYIPRDVAILKDSS